MPCDGESKQGQLAMKRCGRMRMAGTDDAEIAIREFINGEGAAMRSDVEANLVKTHAMDSGLFPG